MFFSYLLVAAALLPLNKCTTLAANETYHIKPSMNASCMEDTCLTLSQFIGTLSESYLHLNVTLSLIFHPGSHVLSKQLNISAVSTISIFSTLSTPNPTVVCEQNASIIFSHVAVVHISNLKFFGCYGHKIIVVNQFMLINTSFLNHSKSAIELVSSEASLTGCSFLSNFGGTDVYYNINVVSGKSVSIPVGAAILSKWSNINISECVFEGNTAEMGGAIFVELHSKILIINSTFQRNYVHPSEGSDHCSHECIGGVLYSRNSTTIRVHNSSFSDNGFKVVKQSRSKGGVFGLFDSKIFVEHCMFADNGPTSLGGYGGVLYVKNTTVFINESEFVNNDKTIFGGVIDMVDTIFVVTMTTFTRNKGKCGGVILSKRSDITISDSEFNHNYVPHTDIKELSPYSTFYLGNSLIYCNKYIDSYGGVVLAADTKLSITRSIFSSNKAHDGGVFYILSGVIAMVTASQFSNNLAKQNGGAIYVHILGPASNISIHDTNYTSNQAEKGGIIYADGKSLIQIRDSIMNNNTAKQGMIYLLQSVGLLSHNTITANKGSIVAYLSNISCASSTIKMFLPHPETAKSVALHQGGAITAFQSNVLLKENCYLLSNQAIEGGAIHATESKINVYGKTIIAYNRASISGGGIYLFQSELNCRGSSILKLRSNRADKNGGGVHAISSFLLVEISTYIYAKILFIDNNAEYAGGGAFLELNSKFYILVTYDNPHIDHVYPRHPMSFAVNSADYGGAMYIADETNSGTCASESYNIASTTTECFMQKLSLHHNNVVGKDTLDTTFIRNQARISGSILFGGLLDRCTVSLFAVDHDSTYHSRLQDGITYLQGFTDIRYYTLRSATTISSHPVRVCFCNEIQEPDCSYYPPPVPVKKGEKFEISIVAVDQINHTTPNVTIRSFLLSSQGGLGENQLNQSTGEACTNLTFSVTSPHESEQLILYADGPCKDAPLSRKTVIVNFTACKCPVGLQQNLAKNTTCECECNDNLHLYVTKCDPKTGTVLRESNFWVDYIDGYLIHPHCPFDYCKASEEKIEINLNVQHGADVQCDKNRAGILCGTCIANYSLSLGSSRCISCPVHWPAILIALLLFSTLAGVLLVTVLLTLNLTVAIGTLNGVIFYANVVAANTNSVFPSNPVIAWLNLEPGFDICFIKGMNAYWKTWLQLAFPAYVIILVAMVIIISERSKRFSDLIGKKDPVATLATLVLLSYAKLLHTIIASLSGTFLDYPDTKAHDVVVWLPDASVKYLSGEHIPLFIAAILILLAGIVYTTIVFAWQWILGFTCIKATKLSLFIHTYHAPYTPKHRYWTGLLLIARIALYIIFAANIKGDPRVNLIAIGVTVAGILLLKYLVEGSSHIYQRRPIEILEVACHFNLVFISIVSFFVLENKAVKTILAHISMSVTIVLLVAVLLYHIFSEVVFKTKLWKRYKQAALRQRQLILDATSDTITEDSDFSTPSCTVVEGPKEHALLLRGREEGRVMKETSIDAACELRETLLDKNDAYY